MSGIRYTEEFKRDAVAQVTVTAAANITSSDGVLVSSIFGISAADAVAGDEVEIGTVGVYELPKFSTAVIA